MSSRVVVAKDDSEKQFRKELEKEYDIIVNKVIQVAFDTFYKAIEHIKILCPWIEISLEGMSMRKKIVYGEIVRNNEEASVDGWEDDGDGRKD